MKLTREDIRISLQGKSKEEITNIYNLLVSLKQPMYGSLESDLINSRDWECYEFYNEKWCLSNNVNKTKVTIEELKEILQPKDLTLEQQLQKAEAEVKRLKEAIEDSKIKIGDWVLINETNTIFKVNENDLKCIDHRHKKITDSVLLEGLNKLF